MIFFPSPATRFLVLNGTVFVILLMSKDNFQGLPSSLKVKGYQWMFIYFKGIERFYFLYKPPLDLNAL